METYVKFSQITKGGSESSPSSTGDVLREHMKMPVGDTGRGKEPPGGGWRLRRVRRARGASGRLVGPRPGCCRPECGAHTCQLQRGRLPSSCPWQATLRPGTGLHIQALSPVWPPLSRCPVPPGAGCPRLTRARGSWPGVSTVTVPRRYSFNRAVRVISDNVDQTHMDLLCSTGNYAPYFVKTYKGKEGGRESLSLSLSLSLYI